MRFAHTSQMTALGLTLLLAAMPVASFAGQAATTMAVTASVPAICTIAATPLAFGPYDPIVANASTNLDVSPNALTVACTKGTNATIQMDLGANSANAAGGAVGSRAMSSGGGTPTYLTYEIYTTAGRTTVWNTTNTVAYVSAGKAAVLKPVFGQIASGQDVTVAPAYTDTVNVTINF